MKSQEEKQVSRRNFTKLMLSGAGAGAIGALVPVALSVVPEAHAAAEALTGKQARDQLVTSVERPILVDEAVHQRFHSKNIAFNAVARDIGKP